MPGTTHSKACCSQSPGVPRVHRFWEQEQDRSAQVLSDAPAHSARLTPTQSFNLDCLFPSRAEQPWASWLALRSSGAMGTGLAKQLAPASWAPVHTARSDFPSCAPRLLEPGSGMIPEVLGSPCARPSLVPRASSGTEARELFTAEEGSPQHFSFLHE